MGGNCSRKYQYEGLNLIDSKNSVDKIDINEPITDLIRDENNINKKSKKDSSKLKIFNLPKISDELYEEIEQKIEAFTGFRSYKPMQIEFNKIKQEIKGTYFQYNKGCVLYSLINCGWIDESLVPDSMKYYKDHTHKEDKRNNQDLLRKSMSILDLAQLWMNIGGKCPYLELSLKEVKKKIFLVLKEFFESEDEKKKTDLMKRVNLMTWQNKDYYDLIYNIKVKFTPLKELLNDNPCLKNGIDTGVIKKRDIVKFGRHCFIYDETFAEEGKKVYSFQDSLAYFFPGKNLDYNNCVCNKKKGFIFAHEDTKLITTINSDEIVVGILSVIH